MKTDDLIAALAADATPPAGLRGVALLAMALPGVAVAVLFLSLIGVRPDLAQAVTGLPVAWKWLLPALVATLALTAVFRLARPEVRGGGWPLGLLLLPAGLALALFAVQAAQVPMADWAVEIRGRTLFVCLASIVGMGLLPLGAALAALRRGASTRPGLSGFLTGLAVGGAMTFAYALHCDEDAPMFFVVWYGLAILALGGIGAVAGTRALRW